jgi:hypothetical protein
MINFGYNANQMAEQRPAAHPATGNPPAKGATGDSI